MQRRTVTKFISGLCAAGAVAIAGCQTAIPADPIDEAELDERSSPDVSTGAIQAKPVPGEYIVVFRDAVSAASSATTIQALRSTGATIKRTYSIIPGVAGQFSPAQVEALRNNPAVAYVEPNQVFTAGAVQFNPTVNLDRVDQREGTNNQYDDFGFNGAGTHVYVLDTGIRTTHREFAGRIGAGFSALDNSPSVEDCNGHGTHVASIAAGTRFGVAKAATAHSVRVLDCSGNGTTADVIEGLNFVRTTGTTFPSVVNMSLFGPDSPALNDAISSLTGANVPVVVAAGNSASDACLGSPANEPSALTVGATAANDSRAGFSNFGECLDLFAPGVNVLGAGIANNDATATISGTSQAAPHVAGAVALFLQRFPRTQAAKVAGGILGNSTPGVVGDARGSPDLFLFTDFQIPPQASCFGRCGGQSADFSCACDDFCTFFNDCCEDEPIFCK
jgi:aqualysin 1